MTTPTPNENNPTSTPSSGPFRNSRVFQLLRARWARLRGTK